MKWLRIDKQLRGREVDRIAVPGDLIPVCAGIDRKIPGDRPRWNGRHDLRVAPTRDGSETHIREVGILSPIDSAQVVDFSKREKRHKQRIRLSEVHAGYSWTAESGT